MSAVDLEEAAAELYALAPAEFTGRRAELVTEARSAGEKDLAKQISELRKPTVSAWLVNQVVADEEAADDVERLEPLGDRLRAAQAALDAPRMKELNRERQELVAALVRRAGALADDRPGAGVQRELEETFGAAVADEQAALAVTSGRLTRALAYAGFGEVDVSAATATPIGASRRARSAAGQGGAGGTGSSGAGGAAGPGRSAGSRSRKSAPPDPEAEAAQAAAEQEAARAAAATELDEARAALLAAEDGFRESTERLERVQAHEAELSGQLNELQKEIVRVRHELDGVTRTVTSAEREHQRAERRARDAAKAVQAAERELAESS